MENRIIMSLWDHSTLANTLATRLQIAMGFIEKRDFPDGESYIRIDADVRNKTVLLVCALDHPNNKILPLMFSAKTLKELGAKNICLVAPYLPYMRQDKRFKPGEAITSVLFAHDLSHWIDSLITVDPHLHRIQNLSQIYSIHSISVLHATGKIAEWIQNNVDSPFIIGPDEESEQWVADIANTIHAPYVIIKKTRLGVKKINVSVPHFNETNRVPVLVDDIISTGSSMIAAMSVLVSRGLKKPVCIGIHALFNSEASNSLMLAGAEKIVSCNTIAHPSNAIDIADLFVEEINRLRS